MARTHIKKVSSEYIVAPQAKIEKMEEHSIDDFTRIEVNKEKTLEEMSENEIKTELRNIAREMFSYVKHLVTSSANKQNKTANQIRLEIRNSFRINNPELRDLAKARSSVSYMRMQVPARFHRGQSGVQNWILNEFGEFVSIDDPRNVPGINKTKIYNNQGITADQMKRHMALNDRFHFRGPKWQKKR